MYYLLSEFYKETWYDVEDWGMYDFLFRMNYMIDKKKKEVQEIKKSQAKHKQRR